MMVSLVSKSYRRSLSHHSGQTGGLILPDSEISSEIASRVGHAVGWLPRHSITRRTSKIIREVQCIWKAKIGPEASVAPVEKILPLFNDLQIFPTNTQVNEMLQCAQKCAGRNSAKYLTFAEFCIFATELKRSIHGRVHRREYFSRLLQKDGLHKNSKRSVRKMSNSSFKEIFLGGSCNPTTWRRDEAIPMLEKYGLTFYNPQVSEWSPELIEVEHQAKQNAAVLLYVIDNQTRNVVSLIETANFLGSRRKIVIVMNLYQGPGQIIASERISTEEFNDLSASLCLLKQLLERRNIPVFTEVNDAVMYAAEVIRGSDNAREEVVKGGLKLMKMKEAFESLDTEKCGLISSSDIFKAFRLFTEKRSQSAELRRNIMQKIERQNKPNDEEMKMNFEQFCKIISELNLNCDKTFLNNNMNRRKNCTKFFRSLSTPDDNSAFTSDNRKLHLTDIYLGGDCHMCSSWREKIAIPMIRNACLTFYNPENERRTNQRLPPSEFAITNNSNVLLFVIDNGTRSLFTMILASYYLGVGANMVLCIQQLTERCVIGSDELSPIALKDYNRGRLYLTDMARQENVPVYDSIPDAVDAAIKKCIG